MGKIIRYMAALLMLLLVLSGCAGKAETDTPPPPKELKAADYFPVRENVKYVYEGQGNEFAAYEVYVEYASEDAVQQRIENGGTVLARVYEIKNGTVTRVFSKGEVYYRENMIGQEDDAKEVLLMEPLKKGTSWTLEDGRRRTITGIATEVETPAGTYNTIEVVTEGSDETTVDYYAKDVGLVKTIFQSGGMEISSTLKSVEEDAARTEKIRFYFPELDSEKINAQEKEVIWRTNDSTAEILEAAYREAVDENDATVLPTDAAIKSLSLDEMRRVKLDFNAAFAENMNAGAAFETLILQSIADTFGNYFNSEEVILTVEGKPYESGHIEMEEGESIPVKPEGI